MEYREYSDRIYVRLDKGDEIIASLVEICDQKQITAAQIQGIGGCQKAIVGVFDPDKKEYERDEVTAMLEMISLDGNVTMHEGRPFIHAHATFAYRDGDKTAVLCGHLLEAVIGLTGEIVITPADGHITRRYDDALGIRVWEFR